MGGLLGLLGKGLLRRHKPQAGKPGCLTCSPNAMPKGESFSRRPRRVSGDGRNRTSVFLYITDDLFMGIGGGNHGLYTAMIDSPEYGAARNLIDPSKSEKEVTLVVGGQSSGYPERMCVDLSKTLQAARTFA